MPATGDPGDTVVMKDRRKNRRRRREELIDKLEAIHLLVVDADAYQSAFEAIYGDTSWLTDGDPDRRRARNRMSCFVELLNQTLDDLLRESRETVELCDEAVIRSARGSRWAARAPGRYPDTCKWLRVDVDRVRAGHWRSSVARSCGTVRCRCSRSTVTLAGRAARTRGATRPTGHGGVSSPCSA